MSRIGLPVSVVAVALLAIPLAFVNPRLGSSVNIVIGVLIYFTYTNLNGLMRSWIAQERIGFSLGVLGNACGRPRDRALPVPSPHEPAAAVARAPARACAVAVQAAAAPAGRLSRCA